MRVVLDRSLFERNTDFEVFLSDLVGMVIRRGHRLDTRPGWGTAEAKGLLERWEQHTSRKHYRRLRLALDTAPAPWIAASRELQLVITASGPINIPQNSRRFEMPAGDDVLRWVEKPLQIVVEDQNDDWRFLTLCVDPDWSALLQRAIHEGWIRPTHGGGTGSIKRLVTNLQTTPLERVRYFILTDSDRPCPGALMGDIHEINRICSDFIPFHPLNRRAIENYVPDAALDRWAAISIDRQVWLAAFRSLSEPQRHYYKLKPGGDGGFARHGYVSHALVQQLYGSLLTDTTHTLHRGPPGDLGSLWSNGVEASDLHSDPATTERRKIYRAIFEAI